MSWPPLIELGPQPAWPAVPEASTGVTLKLSFSSLSRKASSALSGVSPASHRDSRGCGMPVLREISDWDRPAPLRDRIKAVVALMRPLYAFAHSLSTMPYRIMQTCIVLPVKPYQLIAALMHRHGLGPLPLAKAMNKPKLQPQIHRFVKGEVKEPSRTTAEPIAAFFNIPTEAIYSESVATEVAKQLGLTEPSGTPTAPPKPAPLPPPQAHPLRNLTTVWVVGNTQGGLPARVWDDADHPVGITDSYTEAATTDPHAFAVRVVGDSMAPRYQPGEYALVEPGVVPDLEDDVLVRLKTGETMLKRLLSRRGGLRLGSHNAAEVLHFREDEITWMYYVAHPIPARRIKQRVDVQAHHELDEHSDFAPTTAPTPLEPEAPEQKPGVVVPMEGKPRRESRPERNLPHVFVGVPGKPIAPSKKTDKKGRP